MSINRELLQTLDNIFIFNRIKRSQSEQCISVLRFNKMSIFKQIIRKYKDKPVVNCVICAMSPMYSFGYRTGINNILGLCPHLNKGSEYAYFTTSIYSCIYVCFLIFLLLATIAYSFYQMLMYCSDSFKILQYLADILYSCQTIVLTGAYLLKTRERY